MSTQPAERVTGVPIGGRMVGRGCDVYVIAEIGVNHNGSKELALEMIQAAREAGADAVKFQIFSAERIAAADAAVCDYQVVETEGSEIPRTQQELLRSLELTAEDFGELKSSADSLGLDFLATPFSPQDLEILLPLAPPAIKIASTDIINTPLLVSAAGSGLPLIVSTGAATQQEIDEAVELLRSNGCGERLILLHCVSSYPTPTGAARLGCIESLSDRYGVPIGFSDHTMDQSFGVLAASAGAVLLEKHFTLDAGSEGPDHFFSLEPELFRRYVEGARQAAKIRGDGSIGFQPSEEQVRSLSRGSIVAARDIPRGVVLSAEDLVVQRPGMGIPPNRWNDVIGSTASADIPAGQRLTWEMLGATAETAEAALNPAG